MKERTQEESACREAIHKRIDSEYFKRVGEPFNWGAEEGKENTGAARLATLCRNDVVKANRVIDTAIAKADAGDSYFAGLSPSIMASKINELRAWAKTHPAARQDVARRPPGVEETDAMLDEIEARPQRADSSGAP